MELLFGIHAIENALINPARSDAELFISPKGVAAFNKKLNTLIKKREVSCEVHQLGQSEYQRCLTQYTKEAGGNAPKSLPQLFLKTSKKEVKDRSWLVQQTNESFCRGEFKGNGIVVLDQITDLGNIGGIVRTCAFYGVKYVVISRKGEVNLTPQYYKVASGGGEWVELINIPNLSRWISNALEVGFVAIGLDERIDKSQKVFPAVNNDIEDSFSEQRGWILVAGAEDSGISYSLRRVIPWWMPLEGPGRLPTLNVSVALALGLNRIVG